MMESATHKVWAVVWCYTISSRGVVVEEQTNGRSLIQINVVIIGQQNNTYYDVIPTVENIIIV